jgi:hypothetical protein
MEYLILFVEFKSIEDTRMNLCEATVNGIPFGNGDRVDLTKVLKNLGNENWKLHTVQTLTDRTSRYIFEKEAR